MRVLDDCGVKGQTRCGQKKSPGTGIWPGRKFPKTPGETSDRQKDTGGGIAGGGRELVSAHSRKNEKNKKGEGKKKPPKEREVPKQKLQRGTPKVRGQE